MKIKQFESLMGIKNMLQVIYSQYYLLSVKEIMILVYSSLLANITNAGVLSHTLWKRGAKMGIHQMNGFHPATWKQKVYEF